MFDLYTMFSFANLILGLIGFAGGIAIIYYAFPLNHRVYFLDFVERKFGGGSGTSAYRLIGLLLCIFSMFLMVGRVSLGGNIAGDPATSSKTTTPIKAQTIPSTSNESLIGQ
jgi:hypothetical protein